MTAFEQARAKLGKRLRNRAEFFRRKAADRAGDKRRALLIRAAEADSCAEIAETLSPKHVPPKEPDMAAAREVSGG